VGRPPGMSVRMKLTLSYAGFLVVAGVLMLAVVWVSVLRYIPDEVIFNVPGIPRIRRDPFNGFGLPAALLLVSLAAFGLVGGWVLAGRMLAPLSHITDAARLAARGSLSHRIELEGRDDELRELADSFDAMLARLEAQVAEQQRFAANASHELRTPLAITQALLDVARADPDRESDELDEKLRAVNARGIEVTEALLLLSRADQRSFVREPVDLLLVAEEATEALLPLAEKHGVHLHTSGDGASTLGSPTLLVQMATNVVHNAIVHNLADDGEVWVRTATAHGSVELRVDNTGEVLHPQRVATLAEPFQRGTERIRSDHAGVGLGLAIVDSIVRAHDGTLALAARPGGGLSVTVTLPVAPAPAPADVHAGRPAHAVRAR
jgi:two-component system sensor histidine kinase VanS